MIFYSFRIVEEYDDAVPEDFGYEPLAGVPAVGAIIQLHWLDGRDAYRVRVAHVDRDSLTLRVKAVPDEPAHTS